MDYNHQTVIYVLSACKNDDAGDLIAIGGEHSVQVLLVVSTMIVETSIVLNRYRKKLAASRWPPFTSALGLLP